MKIWVCRGKLIFALKHRLLVFVRKTKVSLVDSTEHEMQKLVNIKTSKFNEILKYMYISSKVVIYPIKNVSNVNIYEQDKFHAQQS